MLLVHGPGGIGKTTLLEAFADVAAAAGWWCRSWTGADLAEHAADLGHLGDLAAGPGPRLLLVDGCDELPALARQLRSRVAQRLAAGNRLVVAVRKTPEMSWHRTGWDGHAQSLRLDALDPTSADELLHRRGLDDQAQRLAVLEWSGGHPLALALAADLVRDRPDTVHHLAVEPDLGGALVRHLLGDAADAHQQQVLAALAHAGELDEAALAAALPESDLRAAETWLRGLSFVHPHGSRLRVHDSVREVLSSAYAAADPERSVLIRRNLADHHLRRGLDRNPSALADLASLLRDQGVRAGLVGHRGREAQATGARPDEVEELLDLDDVAGANRDSLIRWFQEAPEHVAVTRDRRGELVGWVVAASVSTHPSWAAEDPVIGPWLEEARDRHPGDAFFVRAMVDRTWASDPTCALPPVLPAGQAWFARRLGIAAERYCFAAAYAGSGPATMAPNWLHASGHRPRSDLAIAGAAGVETWFADHGPGGLIAAAWRAVYADLGLAAPAELPVLDVEAAVRDALRNRRDPAALAANPLGRGVSPEARATHVLEVVAEATDRALSRGAHDEALRRLLELTFLGEDDPPMRMLLRELAVSRATYYRWLDEAIRRIARVIG